MVKGFSGVLYVSDAEEYGKSPRKSIQLNKIVQYERDYLESGEIWLSHQDTICGREFVSHPQLTRLTNDYQPSLEPVNLSRNLGSHCNLSCTNTEVLPSPRYIASGG